MKTAFFEHFFSDGEIINIREIGKDKTKNLFFRLSDLKEYDPLDNEDIYFGVFTRTEASGKAAACGVTRAIWCDYDNMTLASVKGAMLDSGAPTPSIYINSGHGIHAYWILSDPATPSEAIPIVKGLASATGADPKATDTARIMRVPGTFNNKGERVACKIIEQNEARYSLDRFENYKTLYTRCIQTETAENATVDTIPELDHARQPCIRNMALGVREGRRNFTLGRLTKHLQLSGVKKKDAMRIMLLWNDRCQPPETREKLISDFFSYWHGDYKLLGCSLQSAVLQAVLIEYCDRENCTFGGENARSFNATDLLYNGRLLNNLYDFTGHELIIFGCLLSSPSGLSTSQMMEKLTARKTNKPCMDARTFNKAILRLQVLGFVEVFKRGEKAIRERFYKAIPQSTFGLKNIPITTGAIFGAIDGRVTPAELRVYVQLKRYHFESGVIPSTYNIARDFRITHQAVSKCMCDLEKNGYIQRSYVITKGTRRLQICLKV